MKNGNIDYRKLLYLKSCTSISLIQKLKVAREVLLAIKARDMYFKIEGDYLDVDTSEAERLEYAYRYREYQRDILPLWRKYNDGLDLESFTSLILSQNMPKRENNMAAIRK